MILITRFECAKKTDEELHTLLRQAFNLAALPNTIHRSNAMASVQNIQKELVLRALLPWILFS